MSTSVEIKDLSLNYGTVTVLEIRGRKVKLGFDVAAEIPVHRQEVWERIQAEGEAEGPPTLLPSPVPS